MDEREIQSTAIWKDGAVLNALFFLSLFFDETRARLKTSRMIEIQNAHPLKRLEKGGELNWPSIEEKAYYYVSLTAHIFFSLLSLFLFQTTVTKRSASSGTARSASCTKPCARRRTKPWRLKKFCKIRDLKTGSWRLWNSCGTRTWCTCGTVFITTSRAIITTTRIAAAKDNDRKTIIITTRIIATTTAVEITMREKCI